MTTWLWAQLSILLFLVVCSAAEPAPPKEPKRSRLLPYALTPSLRVGRRSDSAWISPGKRNYEKIMTFLRTGRSDSMDDDYDVPKRNGPPAGIWFGPRLGRVQKRDTDDDYSPWTYVILNREGLGTSRLFPTKMGKDLDDFSDETGDGAVLLA